MVNGGPELGEAFSSEPFDHLVFTGSTAIGRRVMGNAAKNLVPVTLELGGKSPVIVSRSADLNKAAFSIAAGKACNGGQICINPDLVYVPKARSNRSSMRCAVLIAISTRRSPATRMWWRWSTSVIWTGSRAWSRMRSCAVRASSVCPNHWP